MGETLDYLKMFGQFPVSLHRFLRHQINADEARQLIHDRMAHRDENFLTIVQKNIYGYSGSPYLPLLKMAGCEVGDLRASVKKSGVEGALKQLREAGVYITFEEFKGRKPIERSGITIPVKASDFNNPTMLRDFSSASGGSTGTASSIGINLNHIATKAPYELVTASAHGALGAPTITWRGILPDNTISQMLIRAYTGDTSDRWFSHIGWRDSQHWMRYTLATYYILAWMRLSGLRVPMPEYVGVEQAVVVARAVAKLNSEHGRCLLRTQVSRAVRICMAAQEEGLDLRGVIIKGGGEPPTPAKISRIRDAGVHYIANYAMTEAGSIASGCANGLDGSDVHLFKDGFALFTYPYLVKALGETVPAFNLTTLLPSAPKIMLNVQMDDYGILEERACGCELESYGFNVHLRDIRSYSKLTGEGVTLIGTDIVYIIENVLPAKFGGTPLDYQLREAEDNQSLTRLYLLIHPRLVIADEQVVIDTLMSALGNSSTMADAARTVWQHAGAVKIKRAEPVWTTRGKLLPFQANHRI